MENIKEFSAATFAAVKEFVEKGFIGIKTMNGLFAYFPSKAATLVSLLAKEKEGLTLEKVKANFSAAYNAAAEVSKLWTPEVLAAGPNTPENEALFLSWGKAMETWRGIAAQSEFWKEIALAFTDKVEAEELALRKKAA